MAQLFTVSGSKIYIGRRVAQKSDVTIADFAGAAWTQIKGWSQSGSLGNTRNLATMSLIDEAFDVQVKGTRAGGQFENTFVPISTDPGQIAFDAAIESCSDYEFKVEWGAGCAPSGTVTISIASPGVVTWAGGHGLEIGAPVSFATAGTLPTGLVAGTTYFVVAAGFTPTTFSVAATPGGTAIVTTGTSTGVHTATGQPLGRTHLFRGLAMDGTFASGGDPNAVQTRAMPIAINSKIVPV